MKETLEEKIAVEERSLTRRIVDGTVEFLRKSAIDLSAKAAFYTPIMATEELANGLDIKQVLQSRALCLLYDIPLAPLYGRVLNYARKRFKSEESQNKLLRYAVDTGTLFGVYAPAYTGVLALSGANIGQIGYALAGMGITIAATARPFGKYVLNNWRTRRNYWKNKQ